VAASSTTAAASGGSPDDDPFGDLNRASGYDLLRAGMGTKAPDTIPGGEASPTVPLDEPYRMPDKEAVDAWRAGVDADMGRGMTAQGSGAPGMTRALAFSGTPATDLPPEITTGASNPYAGEPRRAASAPMAASDAPQVVELPETRSKRDNGFIGSPWAALVAAGLGMMGGTSPFAGVNIGQGGMQGLKTLEKQREDSQKDETIDQATRRLEQEAKFHEDSYNRLTKAQQAEIDRADRPYRELTKAQQAQLEETRRQHDMSRIPPGFQPKADGTPGIEAIPGGPHSPDQIKSEADAKRLPAMSREDMQPMVDAYRTGDHSVLNGVGRGAQGPQNMQQFWGMLAEGLRNDGADGKQLAAAKASFMADSAALRTAAVRESNITTAVNEAKGTLPQVLQRSAELPRSEWVPFNKALEFLRTQTGSPEQRRYGAAIQAAVTTYAQAMSRTGTNSVYAQQHAADVLNRADGPENLKASIEQLKIEMDIALHAPEETRQQTVNHLLGIKGDAAGTQQGSAAPGAAALPDQARAQLKEGQVTTFGNGQKWTLKNGQPAQVP
jgi:hypothetical protein